MKNDPVSELPPHNLEAEMACLGAVLLDQAMAFPAIAVKILLSEAFYDSRNRVIWETMCEMAEDRINIDTVTLAEKLQTDKKLDTAGGLAYVAGLAAAAPSAWGAAAFAEIVADKAALRRMLKACGNAIARIKSGFGSTEELLSQAESEVLAARQARQKETEDVKELVIGAVAEVERLHRSEGALGGLSTGLIDLDQKTDGLHDGEMIVISGFPGSGKTALMMNIVEAVAINARYPVGVFSMEMNGRRLAMRMLASQGRVNLRSVKRGNLNENDFQRLASASARIAKAPIFICDIPDMSIFQLRSRARQMAQAHKIKLIVVDYLQLATAPSGSRDQNREQEVAAISKGCKHMAGELNIPVIVLSQLNDDGKLRESRAIGQDADAVWKLARDVDAEEGLEAVKVKIRIEKQRDGDSPLTVDLTLLKPFTRFENAARVSNDNR